MLQVSNVPSNGLPNGLDLSESVVQLLINHEQEPEPLDREALSKRIDPFLLLKVCSKTGKQLGQWNDNELQEMIETNGIERTQTALVHMNISHIALPWIYTDGIALDKLMEIDPEGYYIYALSQLLSFQNTSNTNQLMVMKEAARVGKLPDYTACGIIIQFIKAKYLLRQKLNNVTSNPIGIHNFTIEDIHHANKLLHKYLTISTRIHRSGGNLEKKLSLTPLSDKWAFEKQFVELVPSILIKELKPALQKLVDFYKRRLKLRSKAIEFIETVTQTGASNFRNQYKRSQFVDIGIIIENIVDDVDPYDESSIIEAEIIARRMMFQIAQKAASPVSSEKQGKYTIRQKAGEKPVIIPIPKNRQSVELRNAKTGIKIPGFGAKKAE